MEMVKVKIDGIELTIPKESTASKSTGINIPYLCYMNLGGADFKNNCASCRIYVLEVEGKRNLAAACATPVFEGMVVKTNTIQTCGIISGIKRGFDAVVSTAFDQNLETTTCTYCGQCVAVCPVGALHENDHTWKLVKDLTNSKKKVVVQVAPVVRVVWERCLDFLE